MAHESDEDSYLPTLFVSVAQSSPQSPSIHPLKLFSSQGSALSGMIARIPCHPIDTLKSRIQAHGGGIKDAFWGAWRENGFRTLYRGFPVAFWGSGPAACLYFTSYEMSRDYLGGGRSPTGLFSTFPFLAQFSAGMFAEAVACVLFVPIDVLKERMQVQRRVDSVYYRSTLDGIRQVVSREGVFGIYRGYYATVLSFGPFSALYFAFYETLKSWEQGFSNRTSKDPISFSSSLLLAATAGSAASLLTTPLDLAKLRLQIQRGAQSATYGYRGFAHALYSIAKNEGTRGLFRGATARIAFHAPTTAIAMSSFESCKSLAQNLLN